MNRTSWPLNRFWINDDLSFLYMVSSANGGKELEWRWFPYESSRPITSLEQEQRGRHVTWFIFPPNWCIVPVRRARGTHERS